VDVAINMLDKAFAIFVLYIISIVLLY